MDAGGDVTVGQQRLVRGDCTDLLPTLPAASVDLVVADLPYGVTANKWDCIIPLDRLWPLLLRAGTLSCVFVFTATLRFAATLLMSQPRLFRYDLIYEKTVASGFLNANVMPMRAHEIIAVFSRRAAKYNPQKTAPKKLETGGVRAPKASANYAQSHGVAWLRGSPRHPRSVLRFDKDRRRDKICSIHPTQKPLSLLTWLVRTYSDAGAMVLDPTSGVASLACAAHREGRRSISIERDPDFYAKGVQRMRDEVAGLTPQPKAERPHKPVVKGQQSLWPT